MKIYLGTDHAGFDLKESVKQYLTEGGHEVVDCGATILDTNDSFVGYVADASRKAAAEPGSRAIVFGGSGQGEAMAANRLKGVRAVVFYAPGNASVLDVTGAVGKNDGLDIIRLSRRHGNSNVLSLGARFITLDQAKAAIEVWLTEAFSDDKRYDERNKELDRIPS